MKKSGMDKLLKKVALEISTILGCDIQIGDVVRLKSGGPAMTVRNIEEDRVYTSWFSAETMCHGCLPPAALERER